MRYSDNPGGVRSLELTRANLEFLLARLDTPGPRALLSSGGAIMVTPVEDEYTDPPRFAPGQTWHIHEFGNRTELLTHADGACQTPAYTCRRVTWEVR